MPFRSSSIPKRITYTPLSIRHLQQLADYLALIPTCKTYRCAPTMAKKYANASYLSQAVCSFRPTIHR